MFRIEPEPNAVRQTFPLLLVREHAILALLHKRLDAIVLNLLFAADMQTLFYLDFDGQTLAVPPSLAGNVVACSRLVPQHRVLEDTCQPMVYAGTSISRGRAFEEDESLLVAA